MRRFLKDELTGDNREKEIRHSPLFSLFTPVKNFRLRIRVSSVFNPLLIDSIAAVGRAGLFGSFSAEVVMWHRNRPVSCAILIVALAARAAAAHSPSARR